MELDKTVIDYLSKHQGDYGGAMFWAMNHPAANPGDPVTGKNAMELV